MKKVWYLENKNNDQARTAKLFLYDKNGIVEAWLDLASFAGVRNQPDWEIAFFSSDGKEIGRISYASGENEDDFWQAAVSGKGRIGEDIAEKLRGHQRTLELGVRVDGEIFASDKGMATAFETEPREQPDNDAFAGDILPGNGQAGDKNEISGGNGQSRDDLSRNASENINGAWSNSELRNEKNASNQLKRTEHEEKRYVDDAKESFDKVDLGNPDLAKSNLWQSNLSGVDWNPDMNEADLDEPDMNEPDLNVNDVSQMEMTSGNADNAGDGLRRVVELSVLEDEMLFRAYVHNSFLLHGYYNYGHLVLDEKKGKSRLGVPGNYYEREEVVAGMFGFPDFEPAKGRAKQTGVFGYYFTKG